MRSKENFLEMSASMEMAASPDVVLDRGIYEDYQAQAYKVLCKTKNVFDNVIRIAAVSFILGSFFSFFMNLAID